MATPALPTPVPVETPAPTPAPPVTERERIYQQYYAAPVEATPETPVTPETPPTPTAPAAPDPAAQVSALEAKIRELEARIQTPTPVRPAEPPPTPVAVDPASRTRWVQLLAEGKFEEATELLEEQVARRAQSQTQPAAVAQAVESVRMEAEISRFVDQVKTQNPDVVEFEPYIASVVQAKLNQAVADKQITDAASYVDAFKKAVNAEVDNARKLFQKLRASGKEEAGVIRQEVLAATPVTPSQTQRGEPVGQAKPAAPMTTADYLADRRARELRMKGLSRD
jgi:hypothetical protein